MTDVRARLAKQDREKKEATANHPPLLTRVAEYKEYFIRNEDLFVLKTKSSNRDKQTLEFVRYVFHKYPVPSFMNYIWDVTDTPGIRRRYHEYEMWYICVATGGSLYKDWFKDKSLTKRETHLFLNCKFDITIPQAVVYAICKGCDAKDGNALRVARSKIVDKRLTEFWKHVMRVFSLEDDITIDQINDIIDYLNHKLAENPNFTISGTGQTVKSLTNKMKDWHYDLRRMKAIGDENWDGIDIPDKTYIRKISNDKIQRWFFKQIKSAKDLQQEGNTQRHCVLSYKQRCAEGLVSIWSLSSEDEYGKIHRKLTIELTKGGSIFQARGIANRPASSIEIGVMSSWARDHGLNVRLY